MSGYRRDVDVVFRLVKDEAVVLRMDVGEVLGLNRTGAFILARLEEGLDTAEVARRLAASARIDEARALADVERFVAELVGAKVLVPR